MAEKLISPGVLTRERDQSLITAGPIVAGAAIVGPTAKGPVEIPTLVTSYTEYEAAFGTTFDSGSDTKEFLTSVSARNYFNNGGETLLVTRVVSGSSFSSATSSYVSGSTAGAIASASAFTLETLGEGTIMNSDSTANGNGVLESGSADNLRWEISNRDTASGTFTLDVRRGDDSTKEKVVLESYINLSLDPKSNNYIAKRIGDQKLSVLDDGNGNSYLQKQGQYSNISRYVRVSSVGLKTPNYLKSDGSIASTEFADYIPVAQSGAMGVATGDVLGDGSDTYNDNISTVTQGITEGDYDVAINMLGNKDEFNFNILTAPGLIYNEHSASLNSLIGMVEDRGDAIAVVDLRVYGSQIADVVNEANSLNTSYAASYWPWLQVSGKWIPASTVMPGVYVSSDNASEAWFAPAGMKRGVITAQDTERKLTQSNRDTLYAGKVNPIGTFPNKGIVVFGQKTLQTKSSALDRVNVRRLLIELKGYISQIADTFVFEQNSVANRNSFLAQVNPYLESVQQRQGLFAYKVVMDESNNTADVIDRNEMVGAIYVQPTKTAEFIYLDFNILPTGATFPA
tara:strand:- start:1025 stop:2734 length:1710 start_codon:yes stop_codon:yes gene_type:complete